MEIREPFAISPRLLPGIKIADAWVSLTYSKRAGEEHRTRFQWYIDLPSGEYSDDDLQSGNCASSLQKEFGTLLAFLDAAGEAYDYFTKHGRSTENIDLFPPQVCEWAAQNRDEIGMLRLEIEESGEAYIVE